MQCAGLYRQATPTELASKSVPEAAATTLSAALSGEAPIPIDRRSNTTICLCPMIPRRLRRKRQ